MKRFLIRVVLIAAATGVLLIYLTSIGVLPKIVNAVEAGISESPDITQPEITVPDGVHDEIRDLGDDASELLRQIESGIVPIGADPALLQEILDQLPSGASTQRIPEYRRDEFGEPWADVDGNSCDTRNDILTRDLTSTSFDDRCRVLTGVLNDPYTGTTIVFTRSEKTSAAVQIDHVAPLKYAWESGAYAWTAAERVQFANDPLNLFAVDGDTNSSKGAKGPAEWMPPNVEFHCEYATAFTAVAAKYDLKVSTTDKDTIAQALETCS